ncbi:MAG: ACT domain-containing protein [Limibacillus sp.]
MSRPGPARTAREMIAGMTPELTPGSFIFTTGAPTALAAEAVATVAEDEGLTMILPAATAVAHGQPGPVMRRITLRVWSSLEGTGLTAAVSSALAAEGIPCNMVAGYHHDHIYVPEAEADRAIAVLKGLQSKAASNPAIPRNHA